jgi:hypothetical protein
MLAAPRTDRAAVPSYYRRLKPAGQASRTAPMVRIAPGARARLPLKLGDNAPLVILDQQQATATVGLQVQLRLLRELVAGVPHLPTGSRAGAGARPGVTSIDPR